MRCWWPVKSLALSNRAAGSRLFALEQWWKPCIAVVISWISRCPELAACDQNVHVDTEALAFSSHHDSFRFFFDLFVAIRASKAGFTPTFGDLLASKMPPERINTLKWESNGELSAHDVFELVKRLNHQEQPARSSQLLHLVNKHRHSSNVKKPAPRAAS